VKTTFYFILALWLAATTSSRAFVQAGATGSVIPTFAVVRVIPDTSVTILSNNFPVGRSFDVLMGPISTQGIGGIKVTTINSSAGGSFNATFNIPTALHGQYQIAIRLENNTGSGYYAYNWFYNDRYTNTQGAPPASGGKPTPTFSISQVKPDESVTIVTQNFPANDRFEALMGYMGSRGIGGIVVHTVTSGAGGSQSYTLTIPPALHGQPQIAIRLQSISGSDYYAYNWFVNNTGGIHGWPVPSASHGYAGFPTFTIVGVVKDQTATITTQNLPPNDRFQVTMGPIGTRGIG